MPMARESDLTLPACCRGEKVEVGARGGGGLCRHICGFVLTEFNFPFYLLFYCERITFWLQGFNYVSH